MTQDVLEKGMEADMSIRVGQNSGTDLYGFYGIQGKAAGKTQGGLMSRGVLGRQSGLMKDVAQFAGNFYESRKKDTGTGLRRFMDEAEQYPGRIAEESRNYANSLNSARASKNKTDVMVKRLWYNYKSISTQLMRAKTSYSARQVVSNARRTVVRLKRQKGLEEYDEREIDFAITHAQAMERVARKRMKHLQEEELVKVTGGPCEAELEELEREEEKASESDSRVEETSLDTPQTEEDAMEQLMEEYQQLMEEYQQMAEASSQEMLSDFQDMMEESMEKLMEESGLSELADSLFSDSEPVMDPADYKMMKLKHRMEELKAIAKADSEYLKALFHKYEQDKAGGVMPSVGGNFGGNAGNSGMQGASVSVAGSGAPAPCGAGIGATVDVSL